MVILNKTGVLKGGVCITLFPRWIQTMRWHGALIAAP